MLQVVLLHIYARRKLDIFRLSVSSRQEQWQQVTTAAAATALFLPDTPMTRLTTTLDPCVHPRLPELSQVLGHSESFSYESLSLWPEALQRFAEQDPNSQIETVNLSDFCMHPKQETPQTNTPKPLNPTNPILAPKPLKP